MSLAGKTIVVGLTGGIACYKAADLVRLLARRGATPRVVMTKSALEFITPLTMQALSGSPVSTDTFDLTQESEIGHIRLADTADAIVIAPATANVIGKLANGLADDLLTTVVTATRAPVLIAPAMNVHMYENSIVQQNLERLRAHGFAVIGPDEGSLACGYTGLGRLSEPEAILEEIAAILTPKDLLRERVLVTAGPNREAIDPVRFLSNPSTGRMGYAVARAARRHGAEVTLVTGPTSIERPQGLTVVEAVTARDMHRAVTKSYPRSTVVVMTAAVADYRPAETGKRKMTKGQGPLSLRLVRNPDILEEMGRKKGRRLLVGFAAETHDVLGKATKKLRAKNLDLIVANDVTGSEAGFAVETNRVHFVDREGGKETLPLLSKDEIAERLCGWMAARLGKGKPAK